MCLHISLGPLVYIDVKCVCGVPSYDEDDVCS